MKRIAAFDIGIKSIGIALTDPLFLFASPLTTVKRGQSIEDDFHAVDTALADYEIGAFVLGWPLESSGEEGKMVSIVKGFEKRLKKRHPELLFFRQDERDSTDEAIERLGLKTGDIKKNKDDGRIDATAAAIILERFMLTKEFSQFREQA